MIRLAAFRVCRALGTAFLKTPTTTTTTTPGTSMAPSLAKALFSSVQPGDQQTIKWRFPADDRAQGMLARCNHGTSVGSFMTLNSKTPIVPDLLEAALEHLYDKIECHRLCCRLQDGQPWVADMPQRRVDFEVVSGTDLDEVHQTLVTAPFNLHDGPLLKVYLLPCRADASCPLPEVKVAFPQQCHVLLYLHHVVNDGMTIGITVEVLFRIIDSLLDGAPVDTKPIGEMRDGVESREEENRIKAGLLRDPEGLLTALRNHATSKHLPLLMEAYGIPNEAKPCTRYLDPVFLDMQMVERLAAKCRTMGVTLNAAFTAALNVAMMEVAREAGLERDVYHISTKHPVDSRRLMKNCKSLPLGHHSIPFIQCTATPRDAKKAFWQYVKHLHAELHAKLKSNAMCEQRVLEALMRPEGYSHEAKFASRNLPEYDNFISFMYSPNMALNQGVGKNVQMTMATCHSDFHNDSHMMLSAVMPVRGHLVLQVAYSTGAVNGEVIKKYSEKSIATLHDVSKTVS